MRHERDADAPCGYTFGMIKRAAFLTVLLCLLSACGNKGSLVMPDKPQDTPSAPAQPAASDATPSDSSN